MNQEQLVESMRANVERIESECSALGGRLIAVVKKQPPERILAAYTLGLRDFAHSYIQESIDARALLESAMPAARWHFIGRIQSNKTRHLTQGWHRIHSVERVKTARRLGDANVLVQVRLGGEHSKAGVDPADLEALLDTIASSTDVQIKGLMALPPPRANWASSQPFTELARLRDQLMTRGLLPTDGGELSMGTSGDYPDALASGAHWVRVGAALLGTRTNP